MNRRQPIVDRGVVENHEEAKEEAPKAKKGKVQGIFSEQLEMNKPE